MPSNKKSKKKKSKDTNGSSLGGPNITKESVQNLSSLDKVILHLFNSASDGSPQDVQFALESGTPYDKPVPLSGSPTLPINIAAQYQRHDNLAVLAQAAMKDGKWKVLDSPNLKGRSCAYIAVEKGNPEMLGVMAKAGANLNRAIPVTWDIQGGLIDPDPEYLPLHHGLTQTVLSHVTQTCIHCFKGIRKATNNDTCIENSSNQDTKEGGEQGNDTTKSPSSYCNNLMRCSVCNLAMYCSRECQKANWPQHKAVCKRIKKGSDLVQTSDNAMPKARIDRHCFQPFQELDHDTTKYESRPGSFDSNGELITKYNWEYYDQVEAKWMPYPRPMQEYMEGLQELGSPRYMYKPGDPKATGMEEREITRNPPDDVSTNHVYFSDMIERHVYTGAGRRVRRYRRKKV